MARYTKVLKSLAHNAVGNKRIESAAPAGNNYYVTGATLGGAPNYTLSLARNGGLGTVDVNLVDLVTAGTSGIAGSITDNQIAVGASTANSIEGSSVLTYDGNKVKLGDSSDTGNYFEVQGDDTENTYDVFIGRRRYPRISLNDRDSYTMQIWALGSELRFGTSAGSNTSAAFVVKSGSAAGAYTFGDFGIGTSSPSQKLDVRGATLLSGNTVVEGTSLLSGNTTITGTLAVTGTSTFSDHITVAENKELRFDSADTFIKADTDNPEDLMIHADDDIFLVADDDVFIQNETNGTYVAFDGANERVGIGTITPSEKLDVRGNSLLSGSVEVNSTTGIISDNGSGHTNKLQLKTAGGDVRLINSGTSADMHIQSGRSTHFTDASASTTFMSIKSDGDVGIGTTSPSYKLDVVGTSQLSGNALVQGNITGTSNVLLGSNLVHYGDTDTYIGFTGDDIEIFAGGESFIKMTEATTDSSIVFNDGSEDIDIRMESDANDSMFFLDSGLSRIGIGTSSPSQHLHVVGNGLFTGGLTVGDSAADTFITRGHTHLATLGNTVGVGLTNPASFSDKFSVQLDTNSGWPIGFTNAAEDVKGAIRTDQGDNYIAFASKSESDIRLFYNDNEANTALIVKGSGATAGNVGIGTTSPSYKLDVRGIAMVKNDSSHQTLELRGDTNYGAYINYVRNNGSFAFRTGMITNTSRWDITDYQGAGYEALSVLSDLKVGINETSPPSTLGIDGAVSIKERADHETVTAGYGQIWVKNASPNELYFTDDAGTDHQLGAGGGTIGGSITDNQVAVGATTANTIEGSANLTYDGTNLTLARTADNTSRGISIQDNEGTETIRLATSSSDQGLLYLRGPTGGNAIYLDGNGSSYLNGGIVGIGTTSPDSAATITILGKIYANVDSNANLALGSGSFAHTSGISNYNGSYSTALGIQSLALISGNAHRNTAVGYRAMYGDSTGIEGTDNTAVGASSMLNIKDGQYNVAVGVNALQNVTDGGSNVAIGVNAGKDLTTASTNTLMGLNAGENITTGGSNNAFGYDALKTNTTGANNTAIGNGALRSNDYSWNTAVGTNAARVYTGHSIVAVGYEAASQNVAGGGNTAVGNVAYYNHTGGSSNVAIGSGSMQGDGTNKPSASSNNTSVGTKSMFYASGSQQNVAVGTAALAGASNHVSNYNVAIGYKAASGTTGMDSSVIIGREAGLAVQDAQDTVGIGAHALYKLTTGDDNTVVGRSAGYDLTTENGNTLIGYFAGNNITASYTTAIGYQALGGGVGATYDVAIGFQAHYNGTGRGVFIGLQAGKQTTGAGVAIGSEAGETNTNSGLVLVGENAGKLVSGTAGGMTTVGHNASSNASGTYHTMVGQNAGQYLKGNVNTGVGYRVFQSGTNAIHQNNTGLGYQVLQGGNYSVTNQDNVAIGVNTMRYASGSSYNVAIGQTLFTTDQTSTQVVSIGYRALSGTTSTTGTVAVGHLAARDLTTGDHNVAIGKSAMLANTTSNYSIAIGTEAMGSLDGAGNSTAIGYLSMYAHSGDNNVAVGNYSLRTGTAAYNVGVGVSAMTKVSGGTGGVAVGYQSGYHPTGNYNTWVGYNAGFGTAAGGAQLNVGIGREALLNVNDGSGNTAVGYQAGKSMTDGLENTIVGYLAGEDLNTGSYNTVMGYRALGQGTTAGRHVAIGYSAMQEFIQGDTRNTAVGMYAMFQPRSGSNNVAVGYEAMRGHNSVYDGDFNTVVGSTAMYSAQGGDNNTIVGYEAGYNVSTGGDNVLIGYEAGYTQSTATAATLIGYKAGTNNTANSTVALGKNAGFSNSSGGNNTFIGFSAGHSNDTGASNVFLGYQAGYPMNANNNVVIGTNAGVAADGGTNDTVLIGTEAGYSTSGNQIAIGRMALYYPHGNYNIAIGQEAMKGNSSVTTAQQNVAIGRQALFAATSAHTNVAVGYLAGNAVTTGERNVILGHEAARYANTMNYSTVIGNNAGTMLSGSESVVIIGRNAGYYVSGNYNTFVGTNASLGGASLTHGGKESVALGYNAMYYNSTANYNVAVGNNALQGDSGGLSGDNNVAIGRQAMFSASSAGSNVAVGYDAGYNQTTGDDNVFIGTSAGKASTTAAGNVAIGKDAMKVGAQTSSDGGQNTVVGFGGYVDGTGQRNAVLGYRAAYTSTSANSNVAIGYEAGQKNTTGDSNVFIGNKAGPSSTSTDSNKLYIHNNEGTPLIGGDFSAATVTIDGDIYTDDLGQGLRFDGRDDLLIRGTSNFKLELTSPQDMCFAIDSDNNGTSQAFRFKKDTKTPESAGTELMSILENGKVGIGLTPDTKLDVNGDIMARAGNSQVGGGYGFTLESNSNNQRYGLKFGSAGNIDDSDDLMLTNREVNGNLLFGTAGSTGGASGETTRMVIAHTTGRVGIGTITPGAQLHIVGGTDNTGGIRLFNGSNAVNMYQDSSSNFIIDPYNDFIVTGSDDIKLECNDDFQMIADDFYFLSGSQSTLHIKYDGGGITNYRGTVGKIEHEATPVAQIKDDTGFIMEDNQGIKNHVATLANFPIDIGTGIATADIQGFSKIQNISLAAYAGGGLPTNLDVKLPVGAAGMEFIVTLGDTALNLGSLTLRLVANGSDVIYNAANAVSNISYTKNIGESIHLICFEANKWSVVAHT